MSSLRGCLLAAGAGASALSMAASACASGPAVSLRVQRTLAVGRSVRVSFHAKRLPAGGYYYAVIVLEPYKHYTRSSPPPCSTSSNMARTDYGYTRPDGTVALALTPAKSRTGRWCRGGSYAGAVYAVPHSPPCDATYPCRSEPYAEPCAGVRPGCVLGVVVRPHEYAYPDGLPVPHASGTGVVARFEIRFPA